MSETGGEVPVTITVDANRGTGALKRIWRSIGYDEINWTYTPIGRRIFAEIAALGDGSYWVRNHNIFSSGNLRSSPYVASTNCYREDGAGKAAYDWTTVDRVYDVYVGAGCKPMVELDFMPHDLSACPAADPYASGRFPPKDYDKWRELNRQFALHLIERYGAEEVGTWYFSTWNEPDGASWFRIPRVEGRSEAEHEAARRREFLKVHDYAVEGILGAGAALRVGGPDIAFHSDFLEMFLAHSDSGRNFATGGRGTRLDFISFHTKGTGKREGLLKSPDFDHVARRDLMRFVEVVRRFPRFRNLPLVCNEWDIDVGSPRGIRDHPSFEYRNTAYFPVFLMRVVKELLDLREREGVNVELITQWTFYFHGMRCFEGTRSLVDPMGIRKPVFNGFEMLARLGEERVRLATDDTSEDVAPGEEAGMHGARRPRSEAEAGELGEWKSIRPHPRVDGLAARSGSGIQVLVWHQAADPKALGERDVRVRVRGLGGTEAVRVEHYRIDEDHSNAHTVWARLGRPDWPDEGEIAEMRSRERLEAMGPPERVGVRGGEALVEMRLPMHAASLLVIGM